MNDNESILAHVESLGGGYVWEPEVFSVVLLVAVEDSDIVPLSALRGVRQIALNASRLSFAAIESVARIPGLESLVLGRHRIGDDQIEALRRIGPEIEFAADSD